jgi:hypothetical protein
MSQDDEVLTPDQIKLIAGIMKEAWALSPAEKAANALQKAGFSRHQLWLFRKTKTGSFMDEVWTCNTESVMHTRERLAELDRREQQEKDAMRAFIRDPK